MPILDYLINIDKDLFLFLNGLHNPFLDHVMAIISGKFTWIPLYLVIIYILIKKYKFKKGIIMVLSIVFLIVLSDQTSVHLFKNVFQRFRPCFDESLNSMVHYLKLPGGKFGFVSSHATNAFAFAILSSVYLKNRIYSILIFIWAILVSYSRIHLGVHFPGDILGGALLAFFLAFMVYSISEKFLNKFD